MNDITLSTKERSRISERAGFVGILCNLLLFVSKLLVGLLANSVSIIADAFNNLSDAGSSVISIVGSKMAAKQADANHPFGHGRIEYIAAFIIAFLVVEVGITAFRNAVGRILHPEELVFSRITAGILIASILIKCFMAWYYKQVAHRIDSKVYEASASDSLQDTITTTATLVSLLIYRFSGRNLDAIIGLIVSIIVIYNGIGIVRETLRPLIGGSIDPALYERVISFVKKYRGIYGAHDLVVHNYGPSQSMASIHAEVDGGMTVREAHEIIDQIERDAYQQLGIELVIHMDPVDHDEASEYYENLLLKTAAEIDPAISIHDFQLGRDPDDPDGTHLRMSFDMVTPWSRTDAEDEQLRMSLTEKIRKRNPGIRLVIHLDKPYVQEST
jgi:cation diffusion facilitator family transporter